MSVVRVGNLLRAWGGKTSNVSSVWLNHMMHDDAAGKSETRTRGSGTKSDDAASLTVVENACYRPRADLVMPTITMRTAAERREIHFFISSTFRDMQEEREEVVKQIFPQLRNRGSLCESGKCRSQRVHSGFSSVPPSRI